MPEKPTPVTKSEPDPLVNEKNETNETTTVDGLMSQLESYKRAQSRYKERIHEMELKLARNHSSPEAMRFRIFLELLGGMAGTILAPEALAKKPGSEKAILKNAAGIAELAYQELEGRPLYGLRAPRKQEPEQE